LGLEGNHKPRAWILTMPAPPDAGKAPRVWGLSANERLRRLLFAGVSHIDRLEPGSTVPACSERCVVFRDDLFYDGRILDGLMASEDAILYHEVGGEAPGKSTSSPVAASCAPERLAEVVAHLRGERDDLPAGMQRVGVLDLASAYDSQLRKVAPPFVLPALGPAKDLERIENQVFAASYKGITDLVTKWVFPRPARAVVRFLALRGVRPNAVTSVSYVLAVAVTWLFAEGWFATGLVLGWLMTFLDTVDGKLARCTLTTTRFGNVFDHGLDLVHPPIWWAAWAIALPGGIGAHELAFWVVVGGYVLGRALEGTFSLAFGIPFFVWRPFDGVFRQVIARRNPNLLLLSASLIVGQPAWGFTAIAVWTAICVVITAARNVQAHIAARRGVEIRSWLDDVPATDETNELARGATA
jgi:phosphatidylglycerophosphate synthase